MRLLLLLGAALAAQPPQVYLVDHRPPVSVFDPPAVNKGAFAGSTAQSPAAWLTVGEQSKFTRSGTLAENTAYARRLEQASPYAKVVTLGKSPQGRDIIALIASRDRAFTPEAARRTGKLIVLIQNGIHPGEADGKDATEMLLREMLVTKTRAAWLDRIILINIPVFNVDGHENRSQYHRINQNGPAEPGFRATAQRLNLNRDYVKADAPEMRAWLRFFHAWRPHYFVDNHVTDGMDVQYDATIDMARNQDAAPAVAAWTRQTFWPELVKRMEADGHIVGPYGAPRGPRTAPTGYQFEPFSPRYSHAYVAAVNRPGLLVETHSLKSQRVRTWAHYDLMRHSLDYLAGNHAAVSQLLSASDDSAARMTEPFPVATALSDESEPFTFRAVKATQRTSALTGAPVPVYEAGAVDVPTRLYDRLKVTKTVPVPAGYYIPAQWTEVIERLQLHGIRLEQLKAAREEEVEAYYLTQPQWAPRPFEGRLALNVQATAYKTKAALAAGTWYVPLNQAANRLIMHLLEPEAPDSLLRWGFFNTVLEQKEYFSDYIFEPIARRMLEQHADLRREFAAKVAGDTAFAASPQARLAWLYERSPYFESGKNVYPVLRKVR